MRGGLIAALVVLWSIAHLGIVVVGVEVAVAAVQIVVLIPVLAAILISILVAVLVPILIVVMAPRVAVFQALRRLLLLLGSVEGG